MIHIQVLAMADQSARSIKDKMLRQGIKDIRIKKGMKVEELIESMSKMGGFSGQNMVNGIGIIGQHAQGQRLVQLSSHSPRT
jgi:hypothetical protein